MGQFSMEKPALEGQFSVEINRRSHCVPAGGRKPCGDVFDCRSADPRESDHSIRGRGRNRLAARARSDPHRDRSAAFGSPGGIYRLAALASSCLPYA